MSKRPLNEIESRLHQAVLSRPNKRVTLKQVEAIVPEPTTRTNALNFLLGVGLLISVDKSSTFRAVAREEFIQSQGLSAEENMIFQLIRASENEGIWTKHLKSKTNLHKPAIERCLRSLIAKNFIKRVSSVQHATRKIYMLEGIIPSVTLTGGPWYTNHELDTHFIRHLTEACLKIIRTLSFPKRLTENAKDALYAPSNAPEYPTASHIRNSLRNARLTDTELSVEDVTKLLDILILDGEIERIPIFGPSVGDSDDGSTEEQIERSPQKRKNTSPHDENSSSSKRRFSMKGTEKLELWKNPRGSPNYKKVARTNVSKNGYLSSKSGESIKGTLASTVVNRSGAHDYRKIPQTGSRFQRLGEFKGEDFQYRAIKSEQPPLGWLESPCNHCPAFDFCKAGGPVNPSNCKYFSNWMACDTDPSELF
ncbi:RNA polymerase Rpc34 [Collybia nuda]|uniref:RNA polymerase Rpc34 n=1 Tax=Collybia nuda TaxID=64659 RepID=A0A9P6CQT1_9AGAR|nr:RNA polymerase Rpc34 [Collybia nuda]